jgi:DNA processing protein
MNIKSQEMRVGFDWENRSDREKMFYNAVAVVLEGSPYGMRLLVERLKKLNDGDFPGWQAAYEYLASGEADGGLGPQGRRAGKKGSAPPKPYSDNMPDVVLEQENMEQRGVRVVFADEPEYPALLREIHEAPLALYVRGELAALNSPATKLTIVGTRRATPDGKTAARSLARELAAAGFTIVSGLAFGIDAEAHEGCLEARMENQNAGTTIAVLARGVDKFYPREHENLGWRILENGGAIISEYPPGEPPYPDRFIERNRIISGLSRGTLVIECPERSGSLATANLALEQNRDVFVVPGPIMHPNFFESHKLIRQGATLVTKTEHILEAYGFGKKEKFARAMRGATGEERQVLLALHGSKRALDVDKIIELTKLEPRVARQAISFLLLKQFIKETKSGYIIE